MKLKDIGINHNGTGSTLVLWVCDDDGNNPQQWRGNLYAVCLLYTSPSPRDATLSRMPSSA